jgi:hypothetical protein
MMSISGVHVRLRGWLKSHSSSLLGWALLVLLGVGAPFGDVLLAQDPDPEAAISEDDDFDEDFEDDEALEDESPLSGGAVEGIDEIEDILEADEDIFAGGGYTYDAGDRRDPFRSLRARNRVELPKGPRPEGKPGLLIEELSLAGVFNTPKGIFAMVRGGPKDKSYLLEEGDQLYDGDVVTITPTEVVFKQIINDPSAIKPFREVVKRLDTN